VTRLSDTTGHWFGLCRKPPVFHTLQADTGTLHEPALVGRPEGSGGGSGTIRRGIDATLSGMRILNQNRQLLWFTLFAGLVLAGNIIGQAAFWYFTHTLHLRPDRILWQFFIELATLFCLVFLLAGLMMSLAPRKDGHVSFFEGLSRANKYKRPLFLWSLVLALAGMLIIILLSWVPARFPTPELLFLYHSSLGQVESFLFTLLIQFPFNLTGLPPSDIFTEIPGYGGRSLLVWIYFGLRDTLVFSAINLILLILTPFVVPHIVLGKKTLREAVMGSIDLVKKSLAEVAACAVFLGIIATAVFSTYLLVQAAHDMITPLATYYRPTIAWFVLGLLYDLALFGIAFVMATIGGIATRELYAGATIRQCKSSGAAETYL
jgi:hypothetical protein